MSNLHIYIAISTFYPLVGGAEKQALAHGRSLHMKGYKATIITFRHNKNWPSHEVVEGVPVIRVAGKLLGGREKLPSILQKLLYLIAMVVMGWKLWQHRESYNIIHLYQLNLLTLLIALVCRLTGKPMIIGVRCADPGKKAQAHKNVSLIAGPLNTTTPWLQVHGEVRVEGDLKDLERLGKPVVRFTRSLLKRIGAVVTVLSSGMQKYLFAHDFILPRMQLIPNGVDIIRFTPNCEDTFSNERARAVVCIARLCYQKGIDVLLQAWRLVHKQSPQARLLIVGIGPLQNQLEYMAEALGIEDSVKFVGLQSDIAAQLHQGSIAVLPSRSEGMPNALLEAMACGLACVATHVSGSEDLIQHGFNGLLVQPEDYQELAQALLALLGDPALARQYGDAARVTVEQHYSLEHVTDLYIELYQRIVGRPWQMVEDTQSSEISQLPSEECELI